MADNLEGVLHDLRDASEGGKTSIGDILDAFENRSLGALLALLGALASIPIIGGIPGASLVIGALILTAIAQQSLGDGGLWAPQALREKEIESDRIDSALEKALPWAKRIDAVLKHRLDWLVDTGVARMAIRVCAVVMSLAFFPLALVPGGVQVPALAILAFGLALISKDGLIALAGYALTVAAVAIGWYAL